MNSPQGTGCQQQLPWQSWRAQALPAGTCITSNKGQSALQATQTAWQACASHTMASAAGTCILCTLLRHACIHCRSRIKAGKGQGAHHFRIFGSDPRDRGSNLQRQQHTRQRCSDLSRAVPCTAGSLHGWSMELKPSPVVSWHGAIQVRCRCIAWEPDLPVCCAHSDKSGLQQGHLSVNVL